MFKCFFSTNLCILILVFLVTVVNTLNTKIHCSKEIAEFSFENADVKSSCCCKQRMKSKLSLLECVKTKFCKPCISFIWHQHCLCGMVWYRTLRVMVMKSTLSICIDESKQEQTWARGYFEVTGFSFNPLLTLFCIHQLCVDCICCHNTPVLSLFFCLCG